MSKWKNKKKWNIKQKMEKMTNDTMEKMGEWEKMEQMRKGENEKREKNEKCNKKGKNDKWTNGENGKNSKKWTVRIVIIIHKKYEKIITNDINNNKWNNNYKIENRKNI